MEFAVSARAHREVFPGDFVNTDTGASLPLTNSQVKPASVSRIGARTQSRDPDGLLGWLRLLLKAPGLFAGHRVIPHQAHTLSGEFLSLVC